MSEQLYQLDDQSTYITIYGPTTIEESTDVMYTKNQLLELLGVDDWYRSISIDTECVCRCKWISNKLHVYVIDVNRVRQDIVKQLETRKVAVVDLPDDLCGNKGTDLNKYLKLFNIKYDPKRMGWVTFKPPVKKLTPTKRHLQLLRVRHILIGEWLLNKNKIFELTFKYGKCIKAQGQAIQFIHNQGITFDDIVTGDPKASYRQLWTVLLNNDKLPETEWNQLVETIKQEYINWFNELIK